MNATDIATLLGRLQEVDNRKVDDETIRRWYELIGDLDPTEADQARVWLQRNQESYITPAAIRARVRWQANDREQRAKAPHRIMPLRSMPVPKPGWYQAVMEASRVAEREGRNVADAAMAARERWESENGALAPQGGAE